jgi:hypothetical protein
MQKEPSNTSAVTVSHFMVVKAIHNLNFTGALVANYCKNCLSN